MPPSEVRWWCWTSLPVQDTVNRYRASMKLVWWMGLTFKSGESCIKSTNTFSIRPTKGDLDSCRFLSLPKLALHTIACMWFEGWSGTCSCCIADVLWKRFFLELFFWGRCLIYFFLLSFNALSTLISFYIFSSHHTCTALFPQNHFTGVKLLFFYLHLSFCVWVW